MRYVCGLFVEKYDPTIEGAPNFQLLSQSATEYFSFNIADSYRKPLELKDATYMLEILDTAGTERFTAMRDLYVRQGQNPRHIVYNLFRSHRPNFTVHERPRLPPLFQLLGPGNYEWSCHVLRSNSQSERPRMERCGTPITRVISWTPFPPGRERSGG